MCPAFTQAVAYVNADPSVGVDNACCGRVQQKGFGGPCLTVGQAIQVANQNSTIYVTGDSLGNASALEQYPIRLRKGVTLVGQACFRGAPGLPVFSALDDGATAILVQSVMGRTCQGEPGGASDGVYVAKIAGGASASVKLSGNVVIDKVDNGIHVAGGAVTAEPLCGVACYSTVTISNVINGLSVDGGTADFNGATLNVANASNAGILCQSTTDSQIQSQLSLSHTYGGCSSITTVAAKYGIFAGTGCRTTGNSDACNSVNLGTISGPCPSPKTDRFGIYAEGDAQVNVSGTIRCMSEDGVTLRANAALSTNAPQVTFSSGSLEHSGCNGAYAEVGRLTVFGTNVVYNHTGVVQRSPLSSTDAASAVVNLAGTNNSTPAMNTFKCNGKAEPGLCCAGSNCPNGYDVWNNSGLPLNATSNYWRAAPVAQCICNEQLQSCACSGSALGQTTPPDGLSVLRSPFQSSSTGTVDITGYALVADPNCPG